MIETTLVFILSIAGNQMNGYAPEKCPFYGHFAHLFIHFLMNGHQNADFYAPLGALRHPRKVNGYGADPAIKRINGRIKKTEILNPDYLLQHPQGKRSTTGKKGYKSRTQPDSLNTYSFTSLQMQGQQCPDDTKIASKIYKIQKKKLTRATFDGIPSPADIKFFELNDNS